MKKATRNIILFDDNEVRKHLMPFTYTRPTALLRVGITTISEKWQALLGEATYSYLTVRYLNKKFPLHARRSSNLMVAGHVIPTPALAKQVLDLQEGEALMVGEELIAFNGSAHDYDSKHYSHIVYPKRKPIIIRHLYDILDANLSPYRQLTPSSGTPNEFLLRKGLMSRGLCSTHRLVPSTSAKMSR